MATAQDIKKDIQSFLEQFNQYILLKEHKPINPSKNLYGPLTDDQIIEFLQNALDKLKSTNQITGKELAMTTVIELLRLKKNLARNPSPFVISQTYAELNGLTGQVMQLSDADLLNTINSSNEVVTTTPRGGELVNLINRARERRAAAITTGGGTGAASTLQPRIAALLDRIITVSAGSSARRPSPGPSRPPARARRTSPEPPARPPRRPSLGQGSPARRQSPGQGPSRPPARARRTSPEPPARPPRRPSPGPPARPPARTSLGRPPRPARRPSPGQGQGPPARRPSPGQGPPTRRPNSRSLRPVPGPSDITLSSGFISSTGSVGSGGSGGVDPTDVNTALAFAAYVRGGNLTPRQMALLRRAGHIE